MGGFVYNKMGVCLNPLILWRYDAGNYPEAEIVMAPIGEKWDCCFNWGTLRGGSYSPVSSGRYPNEETAINGAIADARRQLDYIKTQCRSESEFNKLHESFRKFIASRTQLNLF